MLKFFSTATVAALALAVTVSAQPAQARDGAVAAGVIGGLAVGAIVGSQVNRDNGYRGDGYYRNSAYGARECYIERRDFEDQYGRLHVRNVRVCN